MTSHIKIAPSLLAADFGCLAREIERIEEAGADYLHLDIMDGHFVPNISFGLVVVEKLRPLTSLFFDVHLMISTASCYAQRFIEAGADNITIHQEAVTHMHSVLKSIKKQGVQAGISVNPLTSLELIRPAFDCVDMVVLMSVNPGFGGQTFIPETIERIKQCKSMIGSRDIAIQVDGGVNQDNAKAIIEAGATILVAGTAVFSTDDYAKAIKNLRHAPL